jgi:hypothetical protein
VGHQFPVTRFGGAVPSGHPAPDYLCSLHRKRRLTSDELACRLRALDALAAGKLRPSVPPQRHTDNYRKPA